jgi:hypothetical protein
MTEMTDSLWDGIRLYLEGHYYTTKFKDRKIRANQYKRWGIITMELIQDV